VILCSGVFDGLHAGHVRYLQAATQIFGPHTAKIYVAVADDAYIRRHKQREPRWTLAERVHTVEALACVFEALVHGPDGAADAIRNVKPEFFVKGEDWRGRIPADVQKACDDVGTEIVFVNTPGRHSSEAYALSAHE
jgi:cytidyltransferase-like protein